MSHLHLNDFFYLFHLNNFYVEDILSVFVTKSLDLFHLLVLIDILPSCLVAESEHYLLVWQELFHNQGLVPGAVDVTVPELFTISWESLDASFTREP